MTDKNKNIHSGRSMVEMLGVLAIIGVLSVGGIAGYSKAMMKHRLNKQAEQINTLFNTIIPYGLSLGTTSDVSSDYRTSNLLPILKKLNIIPQEMIIEDDEERIKDALNNEIRIRAVQERQGKTNYYQMEFTLSGADYDIESCRNILTTLKENAGQLNQVTAYNKLGSNLTQFRYYGDSACDNGKTCLRDVKMTEINNFCNVCVEEYLDCFFMAIWNYVSTN